MIKKKKKIKPKTRLKRKIFDKNRLKDIEEKNKFVLLDVKYSKELSTIFNEDGNEEEVYLSLDDFEKNKSIWDEFWNQMNSKFVFPEALLARRILSVVAEMESYLGKESILHKISEEVISGVEPVDNIIVNELFEHL